MHSVWNKLCAICRINFQSLLFWLHHVWAAFIQHLHYFCFDWLAEVEITKNNQPSEKCLKYWLVHHYFIPVQYRWNTLNPRISAFPSGNFHPWPGTKIHILLFTHWAGILAGISEETVWNLFRIKPNLKCRWNALLWDVPEISLAVRMDLYQHLLLSIFTCWLRKSA